MPNFGCRQQFLGICNKNLAKNKIGEFIINSTSYIDGNFKKFFFTYWCACKVGLYIIMALFSDTNSSETEPVAMLVMRFIMRL